MSIRLFMPREVIVVSDFIFFIDEKQLGRELNFHNTQQIPVISSKVIAADVPTQFDFHCIFLKSCLIDKFPIVYTLQSNVNDSFLCLLAQYFIALFWAARWENGSIFPEAKVLESRQTLLSSEKRRERAARGIGQKSFSISFIFCSIFMAMLMDSA